MERFINILILSKNSKILEQLKAVLIGRGNNLWLFSDQNEAFNEAKKKEIGIYLIDFEFLKASRNLLQENLTFKEQNRRFLIPLFDSSHSDEIIVKSFHQGAIDYLKFPIHSELIRNKVNNYKTIYFNNKKNTRLLQQIFPQNILQEVTKNNTLSPKKVQNGVILFTDFVNFSEHSKNLLPIELIKKLEYYFSEFDQIMDRYRLEKIKTIGDAYMALAGINEKLPHPAVRSCLVALEIKKFIEAEQEIAIKNKEGFWKIRIGIHMGPLVAGIIGKSRFSFDVWGDSVNIASRAEESSEPGKISITSNINDGISQYFVTEPRGKLNIHKRGGQIEMFYLKGLKNQYASDENQIIPTPLLRKKCGLSIIDFERMRNHIINKLNSELPKNLSYHQISHTLSVEKAAIRLCELEGVNEKNVTLVKTAALYHDAGFIHTYHNNENFAIEMVTSILPPFGYSEEDIKVIQDIIESTKRNVEPKTLLQKIMCDADHDYLGRPDYFPIAKSLREELELQGTTFSETEWIQFQLNFLENEHQYYTITAQNIRKIGKENRIKDLKKQLNK